MTERWPMYPHPPQQPTGFSADPQSHPELRASNADRSRAVTLLDEAHADGRLSDTATSSTDLATPEQKKRKHERLLFGFLPLWWVQLDVLFVGIWLLSSIGARELQYFWPIWPLIGTGIFVIAMSFDRAERRKHGERGDDQTS